MLLRKICNDNQLWTVEDCSGLMSRPQRVLTIVLSWSMSPLSSVLPNTLRAHYTIRSLDTWSTGTHCKVRRRCSADWRKAAFILQVASSDPFMHQQVPKNASLKGSVPYGDICTTSYSQCLQQIESLACSFSRRQIPGWPKFYATHAAIRGYVQISVNYMLLFSWFHNQWLRENILFEMKKRKGCKRKSCFSRYLNKLSKIKCPDNNPTTCTNAALWFRSLMFLLSSGRLRPLITLISHLSYLYIILISFPFSSLWPQRLLGALRWLLQTLRGGSYWTGIVGDASDSMLGIYYVAEKSAKQLSVQMISKANKICDSEL